MILLPPPTKFTVRALTQAAAKELTSAGIT